MEKLTDDGYGTFTVMCNWTAQYKSLCLSTKRLASSLCGLDSGALGKDLCSLMHRQLSTFTQKSCCLAIQEDGIVHGKGQAARSSVLASAHVVKVSAPEGAMSCYSVQQLESAVKSLTGSVEKTSSTDVITEMAAFVRNQILTQSTVVTLGRSSAMPRMALHLMAS